ncbi:hypothetical protein H1Z39_000322 [Salmonella enterica]|nr:hypothetical protein [Salmonella enterica]
MIINLMVAAIKVFPAPAGINRLFKYGFNGCNRVPRASGDKPLLLLQPTVRMVCSPRQRG